VGSLEFGARSQILNEKIFRVNVADNQLGRLNVRTKLNSSVPIAVWIVDSIVIHQFAGISAGTQKRIPARAQRRAIRITMPIVFLS
jgi:hypothetical protein